MTEEKLYGMTVKCASCKKDVFISVPKEWVYKKEVWSGGSKGCSRKKWFCSWKCLRAFEKKYEENKGVVFDDADFEP